MKQDVVFALENAAWPAFLVDGACTIRRANQAAINAFGGGLEGESTLLSAIWSQENSITAEQFLAQWERAPSALTPLKLRGKGGVNASHPACVCSIPKDGQKYFLIQLFADLTANPPAGPPPEAQPQMDAGLAHKQKLDCALQLARTVSLDFNNALTSILGHTSLVLSKMEPNNPWRNSLVEVEKSAAKAAEIANDLAAFSRNEKEQHAQMSGNLNLILQRDVDMFQSAQMDKVIDWSVQLERKLYAARFDEAKMQQAFVKLIENAIEALGP